MLCEHRHGRRGYMQRAQRPSQRLNRRQDFRILTVPASLEITERHHLDEIVECHGFLAAGLADFPVELPPKRHELFAQTLLLIIASRAQVGAIGGTGDSDDAVFTAAEATDDSQGRTGPLTLSLFAVGAFAHFFAPPSGGFGGGGMKP